MSHKLVSHSTQKQMAPKHRGTKLALSDSWRRYVEKEN
jgi:hypothetical protein